MNKDTPKNGTDRSGDRLTKLLGAVAEEGWGSDAGRQAVGIMRSACRREAAHWTRAAGWLTDEGLAVVWEQIDRLVRAGRFADAPGLLRVAARRAYAAEAAAAQTGMGSTSTRGLITAARTAEIRSVGELDEQTLTSPGDPGHGLPAAPGWMRTLAAVLAAAGWAWPVSPLHAVMASAAGAASTSRRCRSAMSAHDTGVPEATWSALDLLTLGSGPGCRPESRDRGGGPDRALRPVRHPQEPRIDADRPRGRPRTPGPDRAQEGRLMVRLYSVDRLSAAEESTPTDGFDPDEAFPELSPAAAEQVTIQIRTLLERSWEYIAIAYQGRAFLALGYRTWDEYVDDRLGDLRLTVPREERAQAVAALSNARMSMRAIAKVLGVGLGTVHRDVASTDVDEDATHDEPAPISVEGRDGKHYPRRRANPDPECSICGEDHPEPPDECPWDLFAQGLGPRPGPPQPAPDARPNVPREPRPADPRPEPGSAAPDADPHRSAVQSATRAVCLVDELAVLPDLVDEIEMAGGAAFVAEPDRALADAVHELVQQLQVQAGVFTSLVDRLRQLFGID